MLSMSLPTSSTALKKTISSNFKTLSYVAVILALWTVAFWDISNIIDDYVNENQFTLVKSVDVKNGTLPFLEDAKICIDYSMNLYSQYWYWDWKIINAYLEDVLPDSDWTNYTNTEIVLIGQRHNKSVDPRRRLMHAAKVIESVAVYDGHRRAYVRNPEKWDCKNFGETDKFLKDASLMVELETIVHKWLNQTAFNRTSAITLSSFGWDTICSDVHLLDAHASSSIW